jgi:hypothetical protein
MSGNSARPVRPAQLQGESAQDGILDFPAAAHDRRTVPCRTRSAKEVWSRPGVCVGPNICVSGRLTMSLFRRTENPKRRGARSKPSLDGRALAIRMLEASKRGYGASARTAIHLLSAQSMS